jgi:hypothetical protein
VDVGGVGASACSCTTCVRVRQQVAATSTYQGIGTIDGWVDGWIRDSEPIAFLSWKEEKNGPIFDHLKLMELRVIRYTCTTKFPLETDTASDKESVSEDLVLRGGVPVFCGYLRVDKTRDV